MAHSSPFQILLHQYIVPFFLVANFPNNASIDLLKWSVGDQPTFFPQSMTPSLIRSQVTREVVKNWMSHLLGLR